MLDLEERNRARKKAMRLLEHMDRTEKGLTDKLRQAEFSPDAVEDAIAYVKSYVSVSYTHLDVYKRHDLCIWRRDPGSGQHG